MTIKVPERLSEITLKQYMSFDKANSEDADKDFLLHRLLSIFTGITMKEALAFPLDDAEDIATEIADVLSQDAKLQRTFTLKGVDFGMIPDFTNLTLGEYVDMEEYLRDTQSLNKAMAVLFRPITKRYKDLYSIEDYNGSKENAEFLLDMPVDVATASVVFFYRLGNVLLLDSQAYLSQETVESKIIQQKVTSLKSTDGLLASIAYARETLRNLKPLQN